MPHVLLATDADWIRDEVVAALADDETQVSRVRKGAEVVGAVAQLRPELVILDMQIGNMGAVATCHAIRHEQAAGRLDPVKVMILLDRADDRWLANTAGADSLIQKPIDAFRIGRAVRAVLAAPHRDQTSTRDDDTAPDAPLVHDDTGEPSGDASGALA